MPAGWRPYLFVGGKAGRQMLREDGVTKGESLIVELHVCALRLQGPCSAILSCWDAMVAQLPGNQPHFRLSTNFDSGQLINQQSAGLLDMQPADSLANPAFDNQWVSTESENERRSWPNKTEQSAAFAVAIWGPPTFMRQGLIAHPKKKVW